MRVVPLDGSPRAFRASALNLSRRGIFVQVAEPDFELGTRVALSLEAGGRALPFAEAEVMRQQGEETAEPQQGVGLRFTRFLNPRSDELVAYLVDNLGRGRPLRSAPPRRVWKQQAQRMALVFGVALAIGVAAVVVVRAAAWWLESPDDDALLADAVQLAPKPVLAATARETPTPVVPAPASLAQAEAVEPQRPREEAQVAAAADGDDARADAVEAPILEVAPPAAPTPDIEPPAPIAASTVRGQVPLPSGAVRNLRWETSEHTLRLSPSLIDGASVSRAFTLEGPPRLVLDVTGAPPASSVTIEAGAPGWFSRVRLGRQGNATRVVVDLLGAAGKMTVEQGEVTLHR